MYFLEWYTLVRSTPSTASKGVRDRCHPCYFCAFITLAHTSPKTQKKARSTSETACTKQPSLCHELEQISNSKTTTFYYISIYLFHLTLKHTMLHLHPIILRHLPHLRINIIIHALPLAKPLLNLSIIEIQIRRPKHSLKQQM